MLTKCNQKFNQMLNQTLTVMKAHPIRSSFAKRTSKVILQTSANQSQLGCTSLRVLSSGTRWHTERHDAHGGTKWSPRPFLFLGDLIVWCELSVSCFAKASSFVQNIKHKSQMVWTISHFCNSRPKRHNRIVDAGQSLRPHAPFPLDCQLVPMHS